jgi:hypothetical protein
LVHGLVLGNGIHFGYSVTATIMKDYLMKAVKIIGTYLN